MKFIDTHSHAYDPIFDEDREEMIRRSVETGVDRILLADVDSRTRGQMLDMTREYPQTCYAMCGVHPTSINELHTTWREEIAMVEEELKSNHAQYIAVGEIGMDLYWSTEYVAEQQQAFCAQLDLSLKHSLPVAIHIREAWRESLEILAGYKGRGLKGVVHAYSGGVEEYYKLKEYGDFVIGIGGVVTFKKSSLAEVVRGIPLQDIVLETDAPYLTPTPHRGKRNESAYIPLIAEKIAQIKEIEVDEVARETTQCAERVFFSTPKA